MEPKKIRYGESLLKLAYYLWKLERMILRMLAVPKEHLGKQDTTTAAEYKALNYRGRRLP